MDSVVREAWLGVLEKRYRAEKCLLKTSIAVPKELKRIILEYSRINPTVFDSFSAEELYYQSRCPQINDDSLNMSIRISHIGIDRPSVKSRWTASCRDINCRILLSHIGIHIINENGMCACVYINPSELFNYILTGRTRGWEYDVFDIYHEPIPKDISSMIDHLIAPLFDVIIWPVLQTLPTGLSYSGYDLCLCEKE